MSPADNRSTRRSLLRRSGAALLALGAAGPAGCVESLPPLGQGVRYGRVEVPDAGPPSYRRWLPAGSALPRNADLDPGYVGHATPGHLGGDVVGVANRLPHSLQKPRLDYFGIGYESYDRVLGLHSLGATYVLEGAIDAATVTGTLVESGYEAAGTYAGYDVFDRSDRSRTAAVSGDAVVWAGGEESTSTVEAVVDAERGAVPRHHEADETFALATDRIGASPWTWFGAPGLHDVGDPGVTALSYRFDDRGVYYVHHLVYPPGRTVAEREVRSALEENGRATEQYAVDVGIEGRVVTVEMRQSHEAAVENLPSGRWPQVTWGVDRESDAITVRHEAGETVAAERLEVVVAADGDRTPTGTQFADVHETVGPGDALTVDVPEDPAATRVYGTYSPPETQTTSHFLIYELP